MALSMLNHTHNLIQGVIKMPISFDRAFSIHDDAMILRAGRASILASNIANADTPNYKARDVDFRQIMQSLDKGTRNQLTLSGTHRDHISLAPAGGGNINGQTLQYRNPLHASLDGNTVDTQVEQARFGENSLLYQTSFTFLNGRIQGLMKALKGE